MLTDKIREYAYQTYIKAAREKGEQTVVIKAGDIHKAMKLSEQYSLICQGLSKQIFMDRYNVELINRVGPLNGSNVYFTFKIN